MRAQEATEEQKATNTADTRVGTPGPWAWGAELFRDTAAAIAKATTPETTT